MSITMMNKNEWYPHKTNTSRVKFSAKLLTHLVVPASGRFLAVALASSPHVTPSISDGFRFHFYPPRRNHCRISRGSGRAGVPVEVEREEGPRGDLLEEGTSYWEEREGLDRTGNLRNKGWEKKIN